MRILYFLVFVLSMNFVNAQGIDKTGSTHPHKKSNKGNVIPHTIDNTYFGTLNSDGSNEHTFANTNIFAEKDIDGIIKTNDFTISTKGDTFRINSSQTVKSIRVFDILARKLIDEKPNKSSFYLQTSNIKKGSILIIRAKLENGFEISKRVMKY